MSSSLIPVTHGFEQNPIRKAVRNAWQGFRPHGLAFPLLVGVVLQGRREWVWLSAVASLVTLLFIATRSSATLHQGLGFGARHGPLDVWGAGTPFLVLRCLAGFVLGLIGFRLAQHPGVKEQAGRMFAGDVAMASVFLLMLVPNSDVALVLLFVPLTVTLAQQRSWTATLLGSPVVHWFGLISYSLYLVHQLVDLYVRTPLFVYFQVTAQVACAGSAYSQFRDQAVWVCDECSQDIPALLSRGREHRADDPEVLGSLHGAKSA